MAVTVTNAGPETDTLHVLPTAWFRNTWSWDPGAPKPVLEAADAGSVRAEHPFLGTLELFAGSAPDGTAPALVFCENETNVSRLYGVTPTTPYPKDGINDHVTHGAATVNPDRRGTKCAFWQLYIYDVARWLDGDPAQPAPPAGLGASHQTGWTGVVADLIRRRHGEVLGVGDVVRILARQARP